MTHQIKKLINISVVCGLLFGMPLQATLNKVVIHPEHDQQLAGHWQVVFDFSHDATYSHIPNAERNSLTVVCKGVTPQELKSHKVLQKISAIPVVDSAIAHPSGDGIAVTMTFTDGLKQADASSVFVSQVGSPHRSRRLVIDIFSQKLMDNLLKNHRGLTMAHNDSAFKKKGFAWCLMPVMADYSQVA